MKSVETKGRVQGAPRKGAKAQEKAEPGIEKRQKDFLCDSATTRREISALKKNWNR